MRHVRSTSRQRLRREVLHGEVGEVQSRLRARRDSEHEVAPGSTADARFASRRDRVRDDDHRRRARLPRSRSREAAVATRQHGSSTRAASRSVSRSRRVVRFARSFAAAMRARSIAKVGSDELLSLSVARAEGASSARRSIRERPLRDVIAFALWCALFAAPPALGAVSSRCWHCDHSAAEIRRANCCSSRWLRVRFAVALPLHEARACESSSRLLAAHVASPTRTASRRARSSRPCSRRRQRYRLRDGRRCTGIG